MDRKLYTLKLVRYPDLCSSKPDLCLRPHEGKVFKKAVRKCETMNSSSSTAHWSQSRLANVPFVSSSTASLLESQWMLAGEKTKSVCKISNVKANIALFNPLNAQYLNFRLCQCISSGTLLHLPITYTMPIIYNFALALYSLPYQIHISTLYGIIARL